MGRQICLNFFFQLLRNLWLQTRANLRLVDRTQFAEETGNVVAFPSISGTLTKVADRNAYSTMNVLVTELVYETNVEILVPELAVRTLVAM